MPSRQDRPKVLTNYSDITMSLALEGCMQALAKTNLNNKENQLLGLKALADYRSDNNPFSDWVNYQIILVETGEYLVQFPQSQSYNDFLINLMRRKGFKDPEVNFAWLVLTFIDAAKSFDTGQHIPALISYFHNVLNTVPPSNMTKQDMFFFLVDSIYLFTLSTFDDVEDFVIEKAQIVESSYNRIRNIENRS